MHVINLEIERRGLTQTSAAEIMGLDQADVSRIAHGRGAKFSIERLIVVLGRLGMEVEFIVRARESEIG